MTKIANVRVIEKTKRIDNGQDLLAATAHTQTLQAQVQVQALVRGQAQFRLQIQIRVVIAVVQAKIRTTK